MAPLLDLGLIPLVCGSLFLVLLFFLMVGGVFRWIRKVPPNVALLVYGFRTRSRVNVLRRVPVVETEGADAGKVKEYTVTTEEALVNYRIVKGGWTLVLPILHEVRELDLGVMTLDVVVENVLSSHAVPLTVDGIAQIKIGSDDTFIATAAEQLLDKDEDEIRLVANETLKGHLRAIIGVMTVEQVYKDREEFSRRVQEVAIDDLGGLGLEIKSFVIKDISDPKGYLEALGRPEIAAKLRDARVAEADTDREATEKEQMAEKAKAAATKDTNIAKAQYDTQVSRERAIADKADAISAAEQERTLEEKKAQAAEQAATRRDRELDAEERRPADAALYASQQQADAARAVGFAEADVRQKTGEAEAQAEKAKGLADAEVIRARLEGEAAGRSRLVQAYNQYGPSALKLVLGEIFLNGLPSFAGEITKHLAEIDELRIVDLGGRGDGDGSGVLENFSDQGLRVLTKILEGAPALLGGPVDDILAALIVSKAKELGIEPEKLQNRKASAESASEEAPSAQPEAKAVEGEAASSAEGISAEAAEGDAAPPAEEPPAGSAEESASQADEEPPKTEAKQARKRQSKKED